MSEATDFAELRRLPPAEAVAYMQGRTLVGETFSAYDLWRDEHGRAFTVSRLARADLLEAMQASLAKSVAGDMSRRDWIKSTEQLLRNAGWWGTKEVTDPRTGEVLTTRFNHSRLQLIFDTNVRQAQAAGQWQRMLRNRRTHPFARYVTIDDDRVRPLHRAWHNTVLPLDDPWWSTHRPPNGYRCRCRVVGVTRREYDAGVVLERPGAIDDRNAPVQRVPMRKEAPPVDLVGWENPTTGQTLQIPAGIDPGFDYNAGTVGRSKALDDMVQAKLARLPAPVAQAARAQRLRSGLPSDTFVGQRPGLADLEAVTAPRVTAAALGLPLTAERTTSGLAASLGQALDALQARGGLVNDDTGWLLASPGAAAAAPTARGFEWELRALVSRAVVVERYLGPGAGQAAGALYRLASALLVDDQLYRVAMTVRGPGPADQSAAGQQLPALDADTVELELLRLADAAVARRAPSGGLYVALAELLRGATLRDGRPVKLD